MLFQGRSKIIEVKNDAHLLYLPFYVHLNILDVYQPGWKEDGIKNPKKAMEFMKNYRWSNFRDIVNAPSAGEFADISNRDLFCEMYNTSPEKYEKDMLECITDIDPNEFEKFE